MIESYQIEILKKRRNARWFWVIVFTFSFLLYFFFQGYYPDVRLGWARIFSEKETIGEETSIEDLIKSFGIINIKVIPTSARMYLESGSYGNNEKRMSNYGLYTLTIQQEGYIENFLSFSIDKEKPYFIEEVSLLETPRYMSLSWVTAVYPTSTQVPLYESSGWLSYSGTIILQQWKDTTINIKPLVWGRYFASGGTIIEWDTNRWKRVSQDRENYIETCPDILWKYSLLSCPEFSSVFTYDDRYLTGVIDIRQSVITLSGASVSIQDGRIQKTIDTTKLRTSSLYHLDDILYSVTGWVLKPMTTWDAEIITTPLDSISLVQYVGTELVILGMQEDKHILLIRHRKDPIDRTRSIILPDQLDYDTLEFHDRKWNLFIESSNALLFIYRAGDILEWIVDGKVLSSTDGDVIYETRDDGIWQATWDVLPL